MQLFTTTKTVRPDAGAAVSLDRLNSVEPGNTRDDEVGIARLARTSRKKKRSKRSKSKKGDYMTVPHADDDYDDDDDDHYGPRAAGLNASASEDAAREVARFRKASKRQRRRTLGVVCVVIVVILLLFANAVLEIQRQIWVGNDADDLDAILAHWGHSGSGTEGLAWYPTDFLRDVVPVPCHSHNDYWRRVPLFSALRAGCIGVEADVWLLGDSTAAGDDLLVGHDPAALQPNRTFRSLYVNPLVDILTRQNPATAYYNETRRGVFDTDPSQTLVLLIDVKTDGATTWPRVVEQLEPLRARGWLSSFTDGATRYGPITAVGTGNTPLDQVLANTTYRDVFFDAPLNQLEEDEPAVFDATNSYYASVSFRESIGHIWLGGLGAEQLDKVRRQVEAAHARDLKVRYWELPAWPIHVRNRVWDVLVQEGVDILNVDDLQGATRRDWTQVWPF